MTIIKYTTSSDFERIYLMRELHLNYTAYTEWFIKLSKNEKLPRGRKFNKLYKKYHSLK